MADEDLSLDEFEAPPEVEAPAAEEEANAPPPETVGQAMGMGGLPKSAKDLESVYDIPVRVSAVLGKSTMQVSELLKLGRGAVVELDRKVGEAIDIYVNNPIWIECSKFLDFKFHYFCIRTNLSKI